MKSGSRFGSKRRREAACKTHSLSAVSAQRTHRAAPNQKEQPAPHLRAAREKLSPKIDVGWTLREDAAIRGSQVAQEASGFRTVIDRKAMRFVPACRRFVIVAAPGSARSSAWGYHPLADVNFPRLHWALLMSGLRARLSRPPSHAQSRAPWARLLEARRRRRDAIDATESL